MEILRHSIFVFKISISFSIIFKCTSNAESGLLFKNSEPSEDQVTNETNSTFENNYDEKFVIRLPCESSKPVQWIVDTSSRPMTETFELHRLLLNNRDDGNYRYKTILNLEIPNDEIRIPLVMSCQTSEDYLNRTVALFQYNETLQTFLVQRVEPFQEKHYSAIRDFDSNYKNSKTNLVQHGPCPVEFNYFVSPEWGNYIMYNWTTPSEDSVFVRKSDVQSFENAYRFIPPLEENCIHFVPIDESVNGSESYQTYIPPEYHLYRPIVFFYVVGHQKRVVKVHFDAFQNFYHHWEKPDESQLVRVAVRPLIAYKGQEIQVRCHSTIVKFSAGTQIGWGLNEEVAPREFINYTTYTGTTEVGSVLTAGVITLSRRFLLESNAQNVIVFCKSPVWNTAEWVIASTVVPLLDSVLPEILKPSGTSKYELSLGDSFLFECSATGTPAPQFHIIAPKSNLNFSTEITNSTENFTEVIITIINVQSSFKGNWTCRASSVVGEDIRVFELKVLDETTNFIKITLLFAGIVIITFVIIATGLMIKFRKEKQDFVRLTEEVVKKFEDGFKDSTAINFNSNSEHKGFEVASSKWETAGTIIGSGAFGTVQKGFVQLGLGKTKVAIKTVHSCKDVEEFESSLMELTIMSYMGCHEHIVSLVAVCTENIRKRNILIGMEYCANGDLLSYMEQRKAVFNNLVRDGKVSVDIITIEDPYTNINNTDKFSTLDLYKWSFQIASGMLFLETKNVLHADLAARNVLLTSKTNAKICDFGLSRKLIESDTYTKKTSTKLPWRWMALESLKFKQFSSKSDVWSYGVVLFEIFSLGSEPWPGMTWNSEFVIELEKGRRLNKPNHGTELMYSNVMLECWRNEPEERITFEEAKSFFEREFMALNSYKE